MLPGIDKAGKSETGDVPIELERGGIFISPFKTSVQAVETVGEDVAPPVRLGIRAHPE